MWQKTCKKLALREIKNAPLHTAARLRDLLLYEKWQWSGYSFLTLVLDIKGMIFNCCRAASPHIFYRNVFTIFLVRRRSMEERWRRQQCAIQVFDTASSCQDMILTFSAFESFLIPLAVIWLVIM